VLVTASGGARMQEGPISLMQMAKTSQVMAALDEAGVLTVSVVTDPTYGGVAASFATLADVILLEPGARLGFAGPRVIQQTINEPLPDGFQRADTLLARGLVDDVVPRRALRGTLGHLLRCTGPDGHPGTGADAAPIPTPRAAVEHVIRDPRRLRPVDPWDTVGVARDAQRPTTMDYVASLFDGFVELHGDRLRGDSRAIVGGLGVFDGTPVALIGHQKGHTTRELVEHDFGLAGPEGYRKAARLMRLAAKLRLPVVTFIDTQGAHPGVDAEENGQAFAIAHNLRLMAELRTPTVAVVLGEGGSGGALALAVADQVLIMENGIYSVISPEGCAAILWRDPAAARAAARGLGLDARALLDLSVVDGVVPEPPGGTQRDPRAAAELLGTAVRWCLTALDGKDHDTLVRERRARYRRFGSINATAGTGVSP
jgi:acetyl-CoA carboxylase carboxyl transferase subunit beta